jgi:hypothetical protein
VTFAQWPTTSVPGAYPGRRPVRRDKRVDALRKNPELLAAIAENPRGASPALLGLILKALE